MATTEFRLTEKAAQILSGFLQNGLARINSILTANDVPLSEFNERYQRELSAQVATAIRDMTAQAKDISLPLVEGSYNSVLDAEGISFNTSSFVQVHRGRISAIANDMAKSITDGVAEVGRWVQDGLRQAQLQSSLEANIQGLGFREQRQRLSDLIRINNLSMPGGYKGNFESYVDMVVRTNLAEANRQARLNSTLERGISLVQIEGYGSVTTCREFEWAIISLLPNLDGIPTYQQLRALKKSHIFKPNCRHERLIPVTPQRFSEQQIADGIAIAKAAVRLYS